MTARFLLLNGVFFALLAISFALSARAIYNGAFDRDCTHGDHAAICNAAGKATILFNDYAPNVTAIKGWPGLGVTEVWVTDEMPVDNNGGKDRSLRPMRHDPTPSGTIFRVVEIPPESAGTTIDAGATFG